MILFNNNSQGFSNCVTTAAANSLTIDFDIAEARTGMGFGIFETAIFQPGMAYTLSFKLKVLQKPDGATISGGRRTNVTTSSIYYVNTPIDENTLSCVAIEKNTGSAAGIFSPACFLENSVPAGHYKIQFYDCAVYEGEFKNPPVTTSLDVKPGSQFLRIDTDSFMRDALNGYINDISLNSALTAYATKIPRFQNIIGKASTSAYNIKLMKIHPNNSTPVNSRSVVYVEGRLYLTPSNGINVTLSPTVYVIKISIQYGSTNTINVTCTREGSINYTGCTIGYEETSVTYGKDIVPYITITSPATNHFAIGYIVYDCVSFGNGLDVLFPGHVDTNTTF